MLDPARDQALALVRRGIDEGRFTPVADPEDVFDALAGTFVYRRLVGAPPPSVESLAAIARAALRS